MLTTHGSKLTIGVSMPRKSSNTTSPPLDMMPGIGLPEHPYERIYPRRFWGLIGIITVTIICSIIVIFIIYQSENGNLSTEKRSTFLFLILFVWFIVTGLISKVTFGRFYLGFGSNVEQPEREDGFKKK